jgi:hypothetical protein
MGPTGAPPKVHRADCSVRARPATSPPVSHAKLVELDSADHLIQLTDKLDTKVNESEEFVQRVTPNDDTPRVLATVLNVEVPAPDAQTVVREVEAHRGNVVRCDERSSRRSMGRRNPSAGASAALSRLDGAGIRPASTAGSATSSAVRSVASRCVWHGT